jgi:hypothetical protein
MPKIHEEAGMKFYVNTRDEHDPAHVHIVTGSGVVILNIADGSLRRDTSAKASDVRKAQQILAKNRGKIQKAWDNVYGE